MKIVNIIQRYPPAIGGSENWCQGVCKFMSKRGCNIEVLTLNVYDEEEFWRDPPVDNCTLRLGRLDYEGRIKIRRYKRSLLVHYLGPHSFEMYFKMFIRIKEADIVHLHTIPYFHNFIGYILARICRKKIILTSYFHPNHPMHERKINYWLLKKCDLILALSNYEKKYFVNRGLDCRKIVVVGSGIAPQNYQKKDFEQFKVNLFKKYNIEKDTKVILTICRKIKDKGVDILIEAVKQIIKKKKIKLFLVGPDSSWFECLYSRLNRKEKESIINLGAVSHQDKVNLLYLCDLFVLPSKFEAFGIVFLEAWICNTAVIGADVGVIPEIIGNSGLTYIYGNIDDLREKIEMILDRPGLAEKMCADGKNKVLSNYTQDKVGKKVYSCYNLLRENKMKILIVSSFFPPYFMGGAEIVAFEQAKMLKKLGHEVQIFCGKKNDLIERYKFTYEKRPFNIIRVNLHSLDIGADSLKVENSIIQKKFRECLVNFSPDIIHFHNMNALPARLIDECKEFNIPAVMTLHDYWPICIKNIMVKDNGQLCQKDDFNCTGCKQVISQKDTTPLAIRNHLMKLSFDRIDQFISPTKYLAEVYIRNGFAKEKISIIRYGIDINRFKNIHNGRASNTIRFGYVGYMGEHKGIEYLIRAFSMVKHQNKTFLYLVGEGERLDYYKSLCYELKLDGRIKFINKIDNRKIHSIYENLDVLVLPSIWPENSPVSILEAMASKMPVLASNIGGISELVEDRITGLLSRPKDISALAQDMENLILHPEKIELIGSNGFNRIKEQNLQHIANLILERYKQTIDGI